MKEQGAGVRGQGPAKIQNPSLITAQIVTDALAKLGGAGAAAVADHLQAQTYKERSLVRKVLSYLLQAGGVKAVRQQGVVIYHLNDKPSGRGSVQAKLWEFACLRFATAKPFTAAEAARLAECDRDYTKRYCRWLWGAGYLAIVSRVRAGALLYQVVGGKEHEPAPPWNRRAEKRKQVGQAPSPATLPGGEVKKLPIEPCTLFGIRNRCAHYPDCMRSNPKLDAALEDFGRALVDITGSIGRAWEVIREMKGELLALAVKEQGHGEPTDGHH